MVVVLVSVVCVFFVGILYNPSAKISAPIITTTAPCVSLVNFNDFVPELKVNVEDALPFNMWPMPSKEISPPNMIIKTDGSIEIASSVLELIMLARMSMPYYTPQT